MILPVGQKFKQSPSKYDRFAGKTASKLYQFYFILSQSCAQIVGQTVINPKNTLSLTLTAATYYTHQL
jgi:hypothetical protein